MTLSKIITVALVCMLAMQAKATDCGPLAERLNVKLGYPSSGTADESGFGDCKKSPANPGATIAAFAHFQKGSDFSSDDVGLGLYDLDVLLVDTDTAAILQHLSQKGALSSDSIALSRISIDTANYTLAPNARAFGVRADRSNNLRENSFGFETINLYLIRENHLRQVLDKLVMSEDQPHSECGSDDASHVTRTLAVAKTITHGLADLILMEKRIDVEEKMENEDGNEVCVTTREIPSSKRYLLKFNGETYVIPKDIKSPD